MNFYAPIFRTATGTGVAGDLNIFADSDQVELMCGHVIFRGQVLRDSFGTPLTQLIVVILIAGRIGPARNFQNVRLRISQLTGECIQIGLSATG